MAQARATVAGVQGVIRFWGYVDGPGMKYETKDGIKVTCKVFEQSNWKYRVAVFSEGEAVGGAGLGGIPSGLTVGCGEFELPLGLQVKMLNRQPDVEVWKSQVRSGLVICIWESLAKK